MKKIHYIVPLLIVSMLVLLVSCKDEEPVCRFPLTEVDMQMIPYRKGDEIRFIPYERMDTVAFTVEKDSLYVFRYPEEFQIMEVSLRSVCLRSEHGDFEIEFDYNPAPWIGNRSCVVVILKALIGDLDYDKEGNFLSKADSLRIGDNIYYDVATTTTTRRAGYPDYPDTVLSKTIYYNKTYGLLQVKEGEDPLLTRVP